MAGRERRVGPERSGRQTELAQSQALTRPCPKTARLSTSGCMRGAHVGPSHLSETTDHVSHHRFRVVAGKRWTGPTCRGFDKIPQQWAIDFGKISGKHFAIFCLFIMGSKCPACPMFCHLQLQRRKKPPPLKTAQNRTVRVDAVFFLGASGFWVQASSRFLVYLRVDSTRLTEN